MFAEAYLEGSATLIELHGHGADGHSGGFDIFASDSPDASFNEWQLVGRGSGQMARLELGVPKAARYFTLSFDDGTRLQTGYRILPIAGMFNCRDQGGYAGLDGKRVAWGKIFRSDHLFNLADEGAGYLDSLKLNTVIDLRGPKEVREYPNRLGSREGSIRQCNFAPDAQIAAFAATVADVGGLSKDERMIAVAHSALAQDSNAAAASMIAQQRDFVTMESCQREYARLLAVAAERDAAPLLYQCRGGKDRTGFAGMLLLGLLGVSEEDIIHDYTLTARARAEKNRRYRQRFLEISDGDVGVADFYSALYDARKEYIEASLGLIAQRYGTIEAYAIDVLGISPKQVASIRALYLQ